MRDAFVEAAINNCWDLLLFSLCFHIFLLYALVPRNTLADLIKKSSPLWTNGTTPLRCKDIQIDFNHATGRVDVGMLAVFLSTAPVIAA
jgi:hypothetical protein